MNRKVGNVNRCPVAGHPPPPTLEPDGRTIYDTANGYLVTDAKVVMRFETSGLLTYL